MNKTKDFFSPRDWPQQYLFLDANACFEDTNSRLLLKIRAVAKEGIEWCFTPNFLKLRYSENNLSIRKATAT